MPRRPQRRRPITMATAAGALSFVVPGFTLTKLYIHDGLWLPMVYTGTISAIAFSCYGYDKAQAQRRRGRVAETTLHTFSMLGGWPGALIAMHFFQHRTAKPSFQMLFWVIVSVWQMAWWVVLRG